MPWPESGELAIPVKAVAGPLATPTSPGEECQQCFDFGLRVLPERGIATLRQYPQSCSGDKDRPLPDELDGATALSTVTVKKPGTRVVRSSSPYRRGRAS